MSARFVADLAWPEVEDRFKAGDIVVLPIGAEAKQHGRHLPMDTDKTQVDWLVSELAKLADILVFPTVNYTISPAFSEFPGSITLGAETFTRLVSDILTDIARHDPFRIIVLNVSGNTLKPLDRLAEHRDFRDRVIMYHANMQPEVLMVTEKIREQACGGHAGEIETSKMLAMAPGRVNMQEVIPPDQVREFDLDTYNHLARFDTSHANYSPTGVYGNPALANEKKGKRLLSAMRKDLKAMIVRLLEEGRHEEENRSPKQENATGD